MNHNRQKYHQLNTDWSVKFSRAADAAFVCQTLSIPPPSADIPPVSWPHLLETPFPHGLSLHLSPDTTQKWPGRMWLSWVSSLYWLHFSVRLMSILAEGSFLCHGDVSLCSKFKPLSFVHWCRLPWGDTLCSCAPERRQTERPIRWEASLFSHLCTLKFCQLTLLLLPLQVLWRWSSWRSPRLHTSSGGAAEEASNPRTR